MSRHDEVMWCFLEVAFREGLHKAGIGRLVVSFSRDGIVFNMFRERLEACSRCYVPIVKIRYAVWAN